MSAVLLDTHAFLWFVFDDPRLSDLAAATIEDQAVTKVLSVATLWEIAIKRQIGNRELGMELADFFDQHVTGRELELLDIELSHLLAYDALPLAHRDPFDRLLVAQAGALGVPILSADPAFSQYAVKIVW